MIYNNVTIVKPGEILLKKITAIIYVLHSVKYKLIIKKADPALKLWTGDALIFCRLFNIDQ